MNRSTLHVLALLALSGTAPFAAAQTSNFNAWVPSASNTCYSTSNTNPTAVTCFSYYSPEGNRSGDAAAAATSSFLAADQFRYNYSWNYGDTTLGASYARHKGTVTFSGPGPFVTVQALMDYWADWRYAGTGTSWNIRAEYSMQMSIDPAISPANSQNQWWIYNKDGGGLIQASGSLPVTSEARVQGWRLHGTYVSPPMTFPTNTPVPLWYYLTMYSTDAAYGSDAFCRTTATARAWVPATGPAFALPAGFTANSTDFNIVNNQFTGTAPYPVVNAHPASQNLDTGTAAIFSVAATGEGPNTYQWLKNGTPLENGPRVAGATTATLTISNVEESDEAEYACVIASPFGEAISNPAPLTVTPPCPCAADFDSSGGTPDAGDIDAFFFAWLNGDAAADIDCSGGTPDAGDIDIYFAQWLNGGC